MVCSASAVLSCATEWSQTGMESLLCIYLTAQHIRNKNTRMTVFTLPQKMAMALADERG